jgi:hypothetical protein
MSQHDRQPNDGRFGGPLTANPGRENPCVRWRTDRRGAWRILT